MKHVYLLLVALMTVPAVANAQRYILKNPKGMIAANVVNTMHFGNDTYMVVEAPAYANLLASFTNKAEAVSEDLKIGLPADVKNSMTAGEKAWHPEAMHYADLPTTKDGHDVIVAVLDTGVDYNHSALANHIYTNAKEIPGNGLDDDGNGYIDDVHGYDFDAKDGDPMDESEHGTHCAGIIGSDKNDANGAQGVAPNVKIMPVRIIGNEDVGFLSNAAAAIKFAVDNGAKVLSASWRVYKSWDVYNPSDENVALLRAAIEYAGQHGAIFVAAAGNESINLDRGMQTDPMYPGGLTGLDNLVVVAASQQDGNMVYFSNYGLQYVNVAAPGNDIISTLPGNQWGSMSGTSMATPLVAGSIARAFSGGMDSYSAARKLATTSYVTAPWEDKVMAGGVIDLRKYLADE